MLIVRPIKQSDLSALMDLAERSSLGITSLPNDKKTLQAKIKTSVNSFRSVVENPGKELYFFVLEDISNQKVVGTAAIKARVGLDAPLYIYKCSQITRISRDLGIRNQYQMLQLVNDYEGCSELCTLFVDEAYRQHGNGIFLSLSRFLFMAAFPNRFDDRVIAECRGVNTDKGLSPFWQEVGRHFFKMDFAKADQLTALTNKQFIADLMPRHPIYVNLLSARAQGVIGKPHVETEAAYHILYEQGFRYHNYVDIFDAGPILEAYRDNLWLIKNIKKVKVEIGEVKSQDKFLLGLPELDFRAIIAYADLSIDNVLRLSKENAHALQVKSGDEIYSVSWPIRRKK